MFTSERKKEVTFWAEHNSDFKDANRVLFFKLCVKYIASVSLFLLIIYS